MTHNQIIQNLKKKLPPNVFFHYLPKSRYNSNPFDCLLIAGETHCIEVKCGYDKLMPHQRASLEKASNASDFVRSWELRGGIKERGKLKRDYYELLTPDGCLILAGNMNQIVNFLTGEK